MLTAVPQRKYELKDTKNCSFNCQKNKLLVLDTAEYIIYVHAIYICETW
jgi:hypothetical protein